MSRGTHGEDEYFSTLISGKIIFTNDVRKELSEMIKQYC
jgi:hypothetical protein